MFNLACRDTALIPSAAVSRERGGLTAASGRHTFPDLSL